jgi:Na+-driven multidrug efflux pump
MQPLVGMFHGAGDRRGCLRFYRFALRTVFVAAAALFLSCQLFAEGITALLLERSSEMFAYAAGALRLFSYSFLLAGFNLCSAGFLNAMEKPGKALVISVGRGIVVVTAAIYLMSALFGDRGLWLATAVSEGIVFIANLALVLTVLIKDKDFYKQKESLRA